MMSCGAITFCTSRGLSGWACTGMSIVLSLLLCSPAAMGQQTSRRAQPKQDKITESPTSVDFSSVGYRTPTIALRQNESVLKSDSIPTSDSSRRRVANVSVDRSTTAQDGTTSKTLRPTISAKTQVPVQANPPAKSLRRNPMGNRGGASSVSTTLSDAILDAQPGVAKIPGPQLPSQGVNRPRQTTAPIQQRFTGQPNVHPGSVRQNYAAQPGVIPQRGFAPPLPMVQGKTYPAANAPPLTGSRSIADSVGNMQFLNAKQFLSQKQPEFKDPKQYLAKPTTRAKKASTAKRIQPRETTEPPRQPPLRIAQDETPTAAKPGSTPSGGTQDDNGIGEFADVLDPISPAPFAQLPQPEGEIDLLSADRHHDAVEVYGNDLFNYAQLTGNPSVPSGKAWLAPDFHHRPLYFEETNLERYGNRRPLQVFCSAAHFFGTIPILPYKLGVDLPYECMYTNGYCRPGDCVPYQIYHRPVELRGLMNQALITTAIVLP